MEDFNTFYLSLILIPCLLGIFLFLLYSSKKRNQGKYIVIIWNVILTSFFLSIIFLGLETYYRFFIDTTDSTGVKITNKWYKNHYTLNNMALRDNVDYQLTRDSKKKHRISFVGDSFTAGQGVKNVEDRFANIIRKNSPNWEVHCIAINGLSSTKELVAINSLAANNYYFDYVILCYYLNDMNDLMPETPIFEKRLRQDYLENLNYIDTTSYFVNTIYGKILQQNDKTDLLDVVAYAKKSYNSPYWKQHKDSLQKLVNTVESNGGKVLVVTFPFLGKMGNGNYELLSVHKQLDDFWKSINIAHLDLLSTYEPFKAKELIVNTHDAHPNEFAHKLAAIKIEEFIKTNLYEN